MQYHIFLYFTKDSQTSSDRSFDLFECDNLCRSCLPKNLILNSKIITIDFVRNIEMIKRGHRRTQSATISLNNHFHVAE